MPNFHIDEVCPKGKVYPMIVHFQNGYITDEFSSKGCFLLENEKSGKKSIATEINNMIYSGEEEEENVGQTLILARNKTTGKVRLIEVGNIELKPVVKSKSDSLVNETNDLELSRKFGSKKHKQIMEQRQKLKVNVSTVTKQMQNVTDSITEEQLDLSTYAKTDTDEFYIPKINREAKVPSEVYNVDELLTEEQYDKISAELEGSDYVKKLIPYLKTIAATNLPPKHIVLLVYANSLFQLYRALTKDIYRKNFVICPHSATLNEIVFKNFITIVNGKRARPMQYKDKALCHALVFTLLVNNYKFDYDEICTLSKLTPRSVQPKIALTGASTVTYGSKKMVQLKIPLNKPALRRKSAKF